MPPSGFSRKSVLGALEFVKGCYEDLLEEVCSGKFSSMEEAIGYELSQIEKALVAVHINKDGNLAERGKA